MATWAQAMLCEAWSVEPGSPADGSMLGSMATVPLPCSAEQWSLHWKEAELLMRHLYEQHLIEVPVMVMYDKWWIRVSCHLHNSPQQYEQLAEVMLEEVAKRSIRLS